MQRKVKTLCRGRVQCTRLQQHTCRQLNFAATTLTQHQKHSVPDAGHASQHKHTINKKNTILKNLEKKKKNPTTNFGNATFYRWPFVLVTNFLLSVLHVHERPESECLPSMPVTLVATLWSFSQLLFRKREKSGNEKCTYLADRQQLDKQRKTF